MRSDIIPLKDFRNTQGKTEYDCGNYFKDMSAKISSNVAL